MRWERCKFQKIIFEKSFGLSTRQLMTLIFVFPTKLQAEFEVGKSISYSIYIQLWIWVAQLFRLEIEWTEHYVIHFLWSTRTSMGSVRARSFSRMKIEVTVINFTFPMKMVSNVKFPNFSFHESKGALLQHLCNIIIYFRKMRNPQAKDAKENILVWVKLTLSQTQFHITDHELQSDIQGKKSANFAASWPEKGLIELWSVSQVDLLFVADFSLVQL